MNVGSPLWHATTPPRPARGGGRPRTRRRARGAGAPGMATTPPRPARGGGRPRTGRRARGAWALGMATSLVAVALITLTPQGSGWAWGSPLDEARWYLTGLDSTATIEQLAGNLILLVVPF